MIICGESLVSYIVKLESQLCVLDFAVSTLCVRSHGFSTLIANCWQSRGLVHEEII